MNDFVSRAGLLRLALMHSVVPAPERVRMRLGFGEQTQENTGYQ